jgi:protein phosphatase
VLAGAAANPDPRSPLPAPPGPAQDQVRSPAPQASSNGHHRRATVSDDDELDVPRRRWPVVTSVLGVLVLLIVGGLFIGWRYTQGQYYVDSDGTHVVIYRGVSQQIAGLHLSSVYKQTPIVARDMPSITGLQLPTSPGSLAKAQQTVTLIERTITCRADQQAQAAWMTSENKWRAARALWIRKNHLTPSGAKTKTSPKKLSAAPTGQPGAQPPAPPTYCAGLVGAG